MDRDSLIISIFLEKGQKADFDVCDCNVFVQPYFMPSKLIYVGAPGMWMVSGHSREAPLFTGSMPMDAYRVGDGGHTDVDWPVFAYLRGSTVMELENRGDSHGLFVARVVGMFTGAPYPHSQQPPLFRPKGGQRR